MARKSPLASALPTLLLLTTSATVCRAEKSGGEAATLRVPVTQGNDIRFRKLSNPQNLSQVRVDHIVQDEQGFMWFGTWNGLNRYDGYKFKVFKHEAGNSSSLSGVYIYSLFKDRSGTLWVGTDQSFDRFDPGTETFKHYEFDKPGSNGLSTIVAHISQDRRGMLWLSTQNGLFRLDPQTGALKNYRHNPTDPSTLGDNDIKSSGEDSSGRFWVATSQSLDEFDTNTGKVKRRIKTGESGVGFWFHEDRKGVFWIIFGSFGRIATVDRTTDELTIYAFDWGDRPPRPNQAYAMLEDREGTMWFGTADAGLMKFDRENRRFISYSHSPDDNDTIGDSRVVALFEDREGNIWTGLHQSEPNFFRTKPLPFEDLTRKSGLKAGQGSRLAGTVYEDRKGVLWIGVNRQLMQINRRTGEQSSLKQTENTDVLSIIEDGPDVLWLGNARPGLLRYNVKTGESKGYRHSRTDPTTLCSGIIQRLLIDKKGTLWSATWDGLCGFNAATQQFTTYKPNATTRGLNYYSIAEAPDGALWLGGNLGLHRFDTQTKEFTVYGHSPDNANSLSDNRVNAILFDTKGTLWVGTQNGLDKFNPKAGNFKGYDQRHGMAGNVVSCILQDRTGVLWMSTNKGVSSFNTETERFANYSTADGLPGPDLTGWGACYQSSAREMFFAGFSGVTSFFPDKVRDEAAVPPTVLTEFRLFGSPVAPGPKSPLKVAINHTEAITLSHEQNVFSIEFSALTYLNPATNRYRYKLDGLDKSWQEVGSDERVAAYTTLPAGSYTFHLQAATSRGPWSPEVTLAIEILPPLWGTAWFRLVAAALVSLGLWAAYQARLKGISDQFSVRLEERVGERTRIAQELHDTLLQNLTGLALQISGLAKTVTSPGQVKERLLDLREQAEGCLREARQSVWDIRSPESHTIDLAAELTESGKQFTSGKPTCFQLAVLGEPVSIAPDVRQQLLRIGREAISNAVQHAHASHIDVRLAYADDAFRLHIADDGGGFDVADAERLTNHFGLATMRERAERIRAQITIHSRIAHGTSIDVVVPRKKEHNARQSNHSNTDRR